MLGFGGGNTGGDDEEEEDHCGNDDRRDSTAGRTNPMSTTLTASQLCGDSTGHRGSNVPDDVTPEDDENEQPGVVATCCEGDQQQQDQESNEKEEGGEEGMKHTSIQRINGVEATSNDEHVDTDDKV